MKNWQFYPLKDITTKIGSGSTPTGGKEAYYKSGISLVRSLNVYDFVFDYKDLAFINEAQAKKLNGVTIEKNDILLNITGASVGRCTIIPEKVLPARVNQHVSIIRCKKNLADSFFLLYCINSSSYKDALMSIADSGATREALTKVDIEKFQVLLPPLPTQQRIASILSAYDDLIEVNNQRIKLLEETARELYKEWFVRMRFPGYKQAKFVKGVPEGWEIKELYEFGRIFTGKTPPTKVREYYDGEIPFIKTPDLHKNQFIFETEEYLTEKGNNTQKRSTLPKGSICVSCIGTGGIVGITTAEKSQTNQQINSLIPKNKKNLEYLFYAISDLKETIELYGYTGATMTNLSKGKFEKLKILFPKIDLVDSYSKHISPMFEQIQILQQQNTQLRQIRDRLLPRLISGKLQIKFDKVLLNSKPEN